jgi:hypothetical protein
MRKNHFRDYATAAFRFYALTDMSSEAYKHKIWNDAIEKHRRLEERLGDGYEPAKPSEAAIMRAEQALEERIAEIADLEAVEKTIAQIERMKDGKIILTALKMVYMTEPEKDLQRGDISGRVHAAMFEVHASEDTIYRWLRLVRKLFAAARGLRV